ncbi:helix-turn-helix domain-containing protein [Streptomyces griseoruber]|uniref:helix-turn-helix domain-containing protein n=1 Tax=Streptomyces griseoruber TaxID=1943 RepID=UPI0037B23235
MGTLEVSVALPRALYEESVGPIPAKPRVIGADGVLGPYVAALGRLLEKATRSQASPKPDELAVLELLGALSSGGDSRSTGRSHYEAACGVIERHLADPALGAGYIAARIGISERRLSRVFAARETGVPQYILGLRLERARRLITSPEGATLTVAEVAHRCGFASPSHFSQKFARGFGVPPAELRRQSRSASSMSG